MRTEKLTMENMEALLAEMAKRSPSSYEKEEARVAEIVEDVRKRGDEALIAYTRQFDGLLLTKETMRVSREELEEAFSLLPEGFAEIVSEAAQRIRAFHERQKQQSWFMTEENGALLGQRVIPLETAGVYVPGGKAAYPSSVLMNVIPAKVAGVDRIFMMTPAGRDGRVAPTVLCAAQIAGCSEIYKIGGAQAIAAMAYGTETIPRADKITGPGNIYVALAKKAVFGQVSIDSVAGPSEILVLADETADPVYAAADLLSQAEHDEMASAVCVTTSAEIAARISEEIEKMIPALARSGIIRSSLDNYGRILIADTMEEAIRCVNAIASEHLELLVAEPFAVLPKIRNAGAVFLGPYASEPLGDYFAGPNHVLPTSGTARFFSALSVDDFVKKQSIIHFTRDALAPLHKKIEAFAEAEGLTAHANSIAVRFTEEE